MALKRMPRAEPRATLRIVRPAETNSPRSDWTDRARALSALARSEPFQRAVRFLSYALLAGLLGVLLLVATATVPVLFGYHTYSVNGGSMEPSLRADSVAVTAPTSPRGLKVGDIIVRHSSRGSPPVLHRIIEITNVDGQRLFVTQGDDNRSPDPQPVALEGPGDKVIYSVPYAGYILDFAKSGRGRAVLIAVPLVLLVGTYVSEKRRLPALMRGAEANVAVSTNQQVSPANPTIVKTKEDDFPDLPSFLLDQLRQLRGQPTDTARQQEERLAA